MSLLPVGFGSSIGYEIGKSLRFRASASAGLSRTPGSASDRLKWTWSAWVKRGQLGSFQSLFAAVISAGSSEEYLSFWSDDALRFGDGAVGPLAVTTALFRDPSAWYHIIFVYDSANATQASRGIFYVNGVQQTNATNAITSSRSSYVNSVTTHALAKLGSIASNYLDGEMAEINFVNGLALTPASFGEVDAATGAWIPKKYTGTYGTNGFYLPFDVGTSLTTLTQDRSGNGNNWTASGVSITAGATYDWMDDTPTNNFATLNPLLAGTSTLTNGNLTSAGATVAPTILPTSGTWYLERDGTALTWTPPAAFPAAAGAYNFGQRPFTNTPTNPTLCTKNRAFTSITTSGSFTGNASADGPFVWLGGNPSTMTINGNAVTFGTHADKTAGGFKVRSSSASYNTAGSNTYSVTVTGKPFGDAGRAPNNAQGNP